MLSIRRRERERDGERERERKRESGSLALFKLVAIILGLRQLSGELLMSMVCQCRGKPTSFTNFQ